MAPQKRPDDNQIIDAAMSLIARNGWLKTTLVDVAAEVNISLADLHARFPSRTAILVAFMDRMDAAVAKSFDPRAADEPARDRLFDVIMARIEALTPYRAAIKSLRRELPRDPVSCTAVACRTNRSLGLMLEAAHLGEGGITRLIKLKGLSVVMMSTGRVWLTDESPEHGPTMAHLDKQLRRVESLVRLCPYVPRRQAPKRPSTDETPSGEEEPPAAPA